MPLMRSSMHDASEPLRRAFATASDAAVNITRAVCGADLRVAPLVFGHLEQVVMQASTPLVLVDLPSASPTRVVWVPVGLALRLIRDSTTGVRLVGMENATTGEAEAAVRATSAYDVFVSVNTDVRFNFGDSDCTTQSVGYFSVVSAMLHELVHGMGMFSLVNETRGAALFGYTSSYDAALRRSCGGTDCPLFNSSVDVQNMNGASIQGIPLHVAGVPIHNPVPFVSGSSLVHVADPGMVMSYSTNGGCRFVLQERERDIMRTIGWQCLRFGEEHAYWHVESQRVDSSTMTALATWTQSMATEGNRSHQWQHIDSTIDCPQRFGDSCTCCSDSYVAGIIAVCLGAFCSFVCIGYALRNTWGRRMYAPEVGGYIRVQLIRVENAPEASKESPPVSTTSIRQTTAPSAYSPSLNDNSLSEIIPTKT